MIKPILIGILTATGFAVCLAIPASTMTSQQKILLHGIGHAAWADRFCPDLALDDAGLHSVELAIGFVPSDLEAEEKKVIVEVFPYVQEATTKSLSQYCEMDWTLLDRGNALVGIFMPMKNAIVTGTECPPWHSCGGVIKMVDRHIFCSDCGAKGEAGCDCGAGYISASAFAAKASARNPGKSNRAIAEEIGVSESTVRVGRKEQLRENNAVEHRTGKDGRRRKMPIRSVPGSKAKHKIDERTGDEITQYEGIKRKAVLELEAELVELRAEIARLRAELVMRPSMDDLRRMDAVASNTQRITTDIDTYNLFRRCLHPDSRNSASDEILHKAWLAFRNLEPRTWDKATAPPPLPANLSELFRMKEAATKKRKEARL